MYKLEPDKPSSPTGKPRYQPPCVVDLGEVARAMTLCLGGPSDAEACGGGLQAGGTCGGGNQATPSG